MKNAEAPAAARTLVIRRIHTEGRDIRAFDMSPEDAGDTGAHGVRFIAGQVALLKAGDEDPSYFAFASAPDDDELEFLIKRNAVGSGRLIYDMQPRDRIVLAGITGHGFALDEHKGKGKDLVFVAMGTGVAPLRSALRHALKQPEDTFGQIVVLYGARTPEDFCYTDEVGAWKAAGVDVRQVISQPDGYEWSGSTGYVQSLLDNVLPNLSDPLALVCGSRQMIEQTRDRLQEMGFAPEAILTNF